MLAGIWSGIPYINISQELMIFLGIFAACSLTFHVTSFISRSVTNTTNNRSDSLVNIMRPQASGLKRGSFIFVNSIALRTWVTTTHRIPSDPTPVTAKKIDLACGPDSNQCHTISTSCIFIPHAIYYTVYYINRSFQTAH